MVVVEEWPELKSQALLRMGRDRDENALAVRNVVIRAVLDYTPCAPLEHLIMLPD